jgi:type IV pilus assembly protein PilA
MKNNKGFSLVELIIVIAIMAVLIAILAPLFIRYVESSRIQADVTAADGIVSALKTAAIDPQATLGVHEATWNPSGRNAANATYTSADTAAARSFTETMGTGTGTQGNAPAKSNATSGYTNIQFTFTVSTGTVAIVLTGTDTGRADEFKAGLRDLGTVTGPS